MEERQKKKAVIAGAAVIVTGVIIFALIAVGNSSAKKIAELLDLGNKYLIEQDYEEAIVAFQDVIAIDPKCEEAYRGLADVYIAMDDYESAIDILQQGMEQTGSEELAAYLEEIKEAYARIQEEAAAREREAAEAAAEAERAKEQEEMLSRVAIRFITHWGPGSTPQTTVIEWNVKGNIINVTEYYDYQSGIIAMDSEYADGNCLKRTYYDIDGTVTWEFKDECEYEYDADGKILTASYYNEGLLVRVDEYDFDGRVVKEWFLEEGESEEAEMIDSYATYEYDADGDVIKVINALNYDNGETDYTETVKEYDSKGRLVRRSDYHEGELFDEETYSWELNNESGESQTIYLQEYERSYEFGSLVSKLVRETFYGESGEILMENLY